MLIRSYSPPLYYLSYLDLTLAAFDLPLLSVYTGYMSDPVQYHNTWFIVCLNRDDSGLKRERKQLFESSYTFRLYKHRLSSEITDFYTPRTPIT